MCVVNIHSRQRDAQIDRQQIFFFADVELLRRLATMTDSSGESPDRLQSCTT
jgi:hypothetical protein